MARLNLHGRRVETVFHVVGRHENAITKSLGWCLSQVPSFLDRLGCELGTPGLSARNATVRLQEHQAGAGVTDLELHAPGYAAWIVEAKRGFTVPSTAQLKTYAARLGEPRCRAASRGLVVLAASDRNESVAAGAIVRRNRRVPSARALVAEGSCDGRTSATRGRAGAQKPAAAVSDLSGVGGEHAELVRQLGLRGIAQPRNVLGASPPSSMWSRRIEGIFIRSVAGAAAGRRSRPTTWGSVTTDTSSPFTTWSAMRWWTTWGRFFRDSQASSGSRSCSTNLDRRFVPPSPCASAHGYAPPVVGASSMPCSSATP